jgi:hypothetical protein
MAGIASRRGRAAAALPLLLAAALSACAGDELAPEPESSFSRIQTEVFDVSCIGCHSAGSQDAARSGLVLERGVAWDNLVGVQATNADARTDRLLRVNPFKPDSSFLLRKLSWASSHPGRSYGSPMPLGGAPLSVGQLEFVRRWIATGALRGGDTLDYNLLTDRTAQDLTPFVPPQPPARGFQMKIGQFSVAPSFERELFLYQGLGNASDVFVNRIETSMRTGSHHFVIYSFPPNTPSYGIPLLDQVRDIRLPNGSLDLLAMIPMAYHEFVGGAMTSEADWSFPPGVALRIPANGRLDLNSHYVNRTEGQTFGEVYANLHTIPQAEVQHEAHSLNLSNNNITLPPNTRTTLTRTFRMPERVQVFLLTSHMHEHGERFVIRIVGGPRNNEIVYESTSWSHPDIKTFTPPIVLDAGESLRSEVTYNNQTNQTIRFGLTSQDEMGIIFGYFYCATACGTALTSLNVPAHLGLPADLARPVKPAHLGLPADLARPVKP